MANAEFYNLEARNNKKEMVSMNQFKDKVVIVVNTASKCGLTPQYAGLESLYTKYKDKGLVILAFPCNQFGSQEPGNANEIESFCQINYGVSFPIFEKTDVNGKFAHPVFVYLKSKLGSILGSSIKWNFTKFIIDKKGRTIKRFGPTETPQNMESTILKLL